jgi:plastocyanin
MIVRLGRIDSSAPSFIPYASGRNISASALVCIDEKQTGDDVRGQPNETATSKGSAMRALVTASTVIAVGLGVWGCGGSGYSNGGGNPTSPTPPGEPEVVTINVVAINGAQSFSPNPSTVPAGQKVV